jgi:hypothetical protein
MIEDRAAELRGAGGLPSGTMLGVGGGQLSFLFCGPGLLRQEQGHVNNGRHKACAYHVWWMLTAKLRKPKHFNQTP